MFLLSFGSASAQTTTGTWTLFPGQTTIYSTQVRPPINADGSSNWPKNRGVIAVQFNLLSGLGPVVFESHGPLPNTTFSFASFTPNIPLTFDQITHLSAVYDFTTGNCYGGSLRWQVRIDVNDTPSTTADDPAIFIYYGTPPNFGNDGAASGCDDMQSQSGSSFNRIGLPGNQAYDTSQFGVNVGNFYDSYAHAVELAGNHLVSRVSLVLDSGWVGCPDGGFSDGPTCMPQVVNFISATVNDNTFVAPSSQPLTRTCDLPEANIVVTKTDPLPTGSVNEDVNSVQPRDTGEFFRRVDCKYIYNLDVSTLGPSSSRQGTYFVYTKINGNVINNPAVFDLR